MTVGGNILLLPLLNPVHVAEEAATLDVLSGGNFVLGVGLGYREGEFGAFDVSLKERAPRFAESIALMRKLWTEDRVTFQGRFYSVQDHGISLKPHRPGGPPVWIAGLVEAAVKRAARIGDAWLIANATTLGATEPLMQIYRDTLRELGKTVTEFPIARECYVGTQPQDRDGRMPRPAGIQIQLLRRLGHGKPHRAYELRGHGARPLHHRRQGLGEGGNRPLAGTPRHQPLRDARAMAGPGAGESAGLHPPPG